MCNDDVFAFTMIQDESGEAVSSVMYYLFCPTTSRGTTRRPVANWNW